MKPKEKAILIILDGWGLRKSESYNAIKLAKTPNFNRLWKNNPHTTLYAAEQHVGLPPGFIGNSEVGHTHLGAGRLIPQELLKINQSIKDGSFFRNRVLLKAMKEANNNCSALHLMGLLSDGGVHSHISHLFALLRMAKKNKVRRVYVHCFLDGRDKQPQSAPKYIRMLEDECRRLGVGSIATIMGRFYAMDRDNRWNREHKAYDAMVNHRGRIYHSATEAIRDAYKRGETDEFVKPSIILSQHKMVKHYVKEHDSIIFFNFREDRARELTRAFVQGKFRKFKRSKRIHLNFVCLTQYDRKIKAPVALPPEVPRDVLGEVMARNRIRQLRIAETEKYAHVTYFFNGGHDSPFPLEDRVLIPSPRVATYDKIPAMSALKITAEAIQRIKTGKYPLIILNYANADMVGHTGILSATIKAVESVDHCLGQTVAAARSQRYNVIITADHGNAEEMSGRHQTSHTLNKVPFILLADKKYSVVKRKNDSIAQVAPTILRIMGLKEPEVYFDGLIR
ncbi:2,3-bisphosphoglycerate-independent phosphoglycerate mutase [Candidatus Woesearchaeota archaeon]|nr:2,3-bisphosphoglycerate-independent phosphoglycerate mutase [Candidatus Woesearchaeota archaeon]